MKHIPYDQAPGKAFGEPAKDVIGRVVLGKADGAVNYCMRVFEIAPGGFTPLHSHPWEHEQFVHAGQGTIEVDGKVEAMRPGDVVFVPGGAVHQMRNTGDAPFVVVCLVPPSAPEL